MASQKELAIIKQAKDEFAKAQKSKDKAGMAAARLKADTARGYQTVTKVDQQGRYYQSVASAEPPKPVVKPKPQIPLATRVRTGTNTVAPKTQMVDFTLPMGNTIKVPAIVPKKNILEQAFDKEENYIDKAKKGDIGGAAANLVGTGLTALQTFYLNAANSADSLTRGEGLPKFQPQMGFTDYDKSVADRRGEKPTIEKVSNINPVLGEVYKLAGEIGTDPLELLPGGMANDIKLAKGTAQGTDAYAQALLKGKMNPAYPIARTRQAQTTPQSTPVPPIVRKQPEAPALIPRAVPATVDAIRPSSPVAPIVRAHPGTLPVNPQITPRPRNPQLGAVAPRGQMVAQNGGLKSVGADTFKGEKSIEQLVNEYGAIQKGEMPRAREIDVPKKTDYGDTQQYARTLQESAIVDDVLFKDINDAITQGSFTKPTIGNKTVVDDANTILENEGLDSSMNRFKSVILSDKKPTSYDIALGNRVLQELQKSGRYDEALNVAIDLSDILSESGRTLQAARIAKRLSPEGRLMIVSRTAEKVSKKTGTKVNLSDDTVKLISEAKTEKEVVEANQKAAKEIWDQVPANWVDKVNSWRYMAMLFNPKTHVRNIVGNALFLPVREFKNLIGSGIEKAIIRDGTRTKAVLNPLKDKGIIDFANKDFQNVKAILKNEGKVDDNVRTLEAKVFNTRILEGIRKLNLGALDAEDTWFMKFAYNSSLAQYMKANKLTPDKMVGEVLEGARSYAMNEALKATYRDFNALANVISRGKHNLMNGKYGPLGRAGGVALEGMVPFAKTPMNIIKRGVAYSPVNVARGMANLARVKSGKVTATEAIDELASGLSGTALLALGTYLGYNNIIKGKEGEYKDKLYGYNQMIGSQNYSLNIDGKSYTLDWAAPLSMPFFVGVEIANAIKDNNADLATVIDSMTQISDPMVNLSMLKGINDIVTNNFEGLGQTVMDVGTGYAGQYNPTLLGQIARTTDDTRRSTISTAETGLGRAAEKFGRKQLAKIPLASKNLEPYVDLWGREQKSGSAVENFLSPGYFKQENITPVDKELLSLVKSLDEESAKKILPVSTAYQYTLEANSEKYRLTEKESTAYQKIRGQESFKGLGRLFTSAKYKTMSEEERVKAVGDVYDQARETAKMEYLKSKDLSPMLALPKPQQEKYAKIAALGVREDQYIKSYNAIKGVEGVTDDFGKTIRLSESFNKKQAIDKANPEASPKELKALYHIFDVSEKVW